MLVLSNELAPARKSSRKAVTKVSYNYYSYYFTKNTSNVILLGARSAFNNCLANLVNTPGAGAQPKGNPTH
jgi:hypothetical protein